MAGALAGQPLCWTRVLRSLQDAAARQPEDPVLGWGLDPIYGTLRVNRHDLDRVSSTRPVGSTTPAAILNVNSVTLWSAPGCCGPGWTIPASRSGRTACPPASSKGPDSDDAGLTHAGLDRSFPSSTPDAMRPTHAWPCAPG